MVRHKDALHEGLHQAIIDDATWQLVQTQLAEHGGKTINSVRRSASRLLDGVLFDSRGRVMRTTYASKSVHGDGTTRRKRYWYYTSSMHGSEDKSAVKRLPAKELKRVVLDGLRDRLTDARWLADQLNGHEHEATLLADMMRGADRWQKDFDEPDDIASERILETILTRIDAQKDQLHIAVNLAGLLEPGFSCGPIPAAFEIPFQKRQNGRAKPIVIAAKDAAHPDPDLIALVADARRWARELLEGRYASIQKLTEQEGLRRGVVSRILPLAWLAPDISTAVLEGRQPSHLNAKTLRDLPDLPMDWNEQRKILGFPPQ